MQKSIAVLDSGVGGLCVLNKLAKLLPNENFLYFADNQNVPYGNKSKNEIEKFTVAMTDKILSHNVKCLVVGCNTMYTNCFDDIKAKCKVDLFAVKPVVATKPCLVFCTKGTAGALGNKEGAFVFPLEDGAYMIENCCSDDEFKNYLKKETMGLNLSKFNSVLLGCTHYIHKKSCFSFLGLPIYDGVDEVAREVCQTLSQKNLLVKNKGRGSVTFFLTDNSTSQFYKYICAYKSLQKG